MKTKSEKAAAYFENGFNCAQSVFSTFCERYGLDEESALKIASGLGGGFRSGEICGAVSGAVLVVGLKYGQSIADDLDVKRNCNAKAEEFIQVFRERNGSIVCRELLGCDLSTEEGRAQAKRDNLFRTICDEKVRNAVDLLDELGY